MLRVLSGEALMKLIILFSFFICYGWIYQAMVKDEKAFQIRYAQRFEEMDKISQGLSIEKLASD